MKALVIIDMQNDFIDGSLGTPEAQAIVPVMEKRMEELAKEKNTLLFYTKDTHFEDYLETQEGKKLPVPHCVYNTNGWCINKRIAAAGYNCDFIVTANGGRRFLKNTFGSLDLAQTITQNCNGDIDEIILMGVCTDICVVSNALLLKAHLPEVKITVDASCCAGVTPEKHKAALEVMKSCQINVINE